MIDDAVAQQKPRAGAGESFLAAIEVIIKPEWCGTALHAGN
jgi:hypothetical protein